MDTYKRFLSEEFIDEKNMANHGRVEKRGKKGPIQIECLNYFLFVRFVLLRDSEGRGGINVSSMRKVEMKSTRLISTPADSNLARSASETAILEGSWRKCVASFT